MGMKPVSNALFEDKSPQLGGDLDVNGFSIISTANGNIPLAPGGTGVVDIQGRLAYTPSEINITAAGGITVTNADMRIQGDGGAVTITANPQIVAGTDGQIVVLSGKSDINTVTISNGNGVHLHSGSSVALGDHDILVLAYHLADLTWEEISSNFPVSEKSWSFNSPSGSSGTFYIGGFYDFGATNFTPAGGTNLGSANNSYAAHAFLVLGASSTNMVVRITGTSITDNGVRTTSDTEDLDTSGGSLNDYFETDKKWIGIVSYTLQSGTGVAVNNGFCKYWDNRNSDFRIVSVEVTGVSGGNDANPDFKIRHHRAVGWTYNAGAAPTPPSEIASMSTDHNTEGLLVSGEPFAWKRVNLNTTVDGGSREGFIGEIVTSANRAIESLDFLLSIRPN